MTISTVIVSFPLLLTILAQFPGKVECESCHDGYFYYSITGQCVPCPSTCFTCQDILNCDNCKPGYYGTMCSNECSKCKNGNCSKNACLEGCEEGNFYEPFDGSCSACYSNCETCTEYTQCTRCKQGFFGSTCDYYCSSCKNMQCSQTTCLDGCADGRHGQNCDRICDYACEGGTCQRSTGICDNGCIVGYYWSNGLCQFCPSCEECQTSECTRFCCRATVTATTSVAQESQNGGDEPLSTKSAVAIGAGIGGGLVVLAIVVFVGIYLLRRSRKPKHIQGSQTVKEDKHHPQPFPHNMYFIPVTSALSSPDSVYTEGCVGRNHQTLNRTTGGGHTPGTADIANSPVNVRPVRREDNPDEVYTEIVDYDTTSAKYLSFGEVRNRNENGEDEPYLNENL